jgi:hypothetical protein
MFRLLKIGTKIYVKLVSHPTGPNVYKDFGIMYE